jgi:AraC-like DNA-binding protein
MKKSPVVLLIILLFAASSFSQNRIADSLLTLLDSRKDTARVNLLNRIADELQDSDPAKVFQYANEALNLAERLGYPAGIMQAEHQLGQYFNNTSDYAAAVEHYLKSLEIANRLESFADQLHTRNNLAVTYVRMNRLDDAIGQFQKQQALAKRSPNPTDYLTAIVNLGSCYNDKGEYAKAETYFREGYALSKGKYPKYYTACVNNLAHALLNQKKLAEAKFYAEEAFRDARKIGHQELLLETMINLSSIYNLQGDNRKAIQITQEAMPIADKIQSKLHREFLTGNLSIYNEALGNYREALNYYKQYAAIKDSIINEDTNNKIVEMETRFRTAEKEKELLARQDELARKNLLIIVFGILILLAVFFGAWLIQAYRVKNAAYQALVKINLDILKEQKRTEQLQEQLQAVSQNKEQTAPFSDMDSSRKSAMSIETRSVLQQKLQSMIAKKTFLDKDLSLEKLAAEFQVNAKYLSQVIHDSYKTNFANFINELRINAARQMLSDEKFNNFTIESIADSAGFNSKQAFNQTFKRFTGLTPSYYRERATLDINSASV